jgi:hypothetical protein
LGAFQKVMDVVVMDDIVRGWRSGHSGTDLEEKAKEIKENSNLRFYTTRLLSPRVIVSHFKPRPTAPFLFTMTEDE